MKKIFTLIAVAMMAVCANAQGTYAVQYEDPAVPVAAGTQEKSVKNITMTWGVAGDAKNFKGGDKKSDVLKDQLGATAYCSGNGDNGKLTEGCVYTGTVYFFEPALDGKLTVGWVLNANKKFYIQECSGEKPQDVTFTTVDSEGSAVELACGGTLAEKLTGGLSTFAVAKGKKYAVYCTGSKLGFYGFKYETTTSGISNLEVENAADNATYNVAGQKVSENTKGLVIKSGKKFINK